MKVDKSQSAVEAMKIYQQVKAKDSEVRISSKGDIREIRLFDRFKEGFRSLMPDYQAENWQEKAKNHIKTKFNDDIQLLGPKLNDDAKKQLDTKLEKIFALSKTTTQLWSFILLPDSENAALNTAILNIRSMDEKVDRNLSQFVRPALQLEKVNLDQAITIAELALTLKKTEKFPADIALHAAMKINSLMHIDKNLTVKEALKIVQFTGALVNKNMLDKDDAHIAGYEVWKLMATYKLKPAEAIAINEPVKSIVRIQKRSEAEAIAIALNRASEMKKMQSALPRGYPLSLTDGAVNKMALPFSDNSLKIFTDYLIGAKDEINKKYALSDGFIRDIPRFFFKFIFPNKTLEFFPKDISLFGEESSEKTIENKLKHVTEKFKEFDDDNIVLETLSKVCDQSAALAISAAISTDLAPSDGDSFITIGSPESDASGIGKNIRSYNEISKTETGDFLIRYTLLQRMTDLVDFNDVNNPWRINRMLGIDFNQDVDITKDNHTLSCEFLVEFKREDLLNKKIVPIIVNVPEVKVTIQIDWQKIDEEFIESVNS